MANEVTLTFAGDEKDLTRAFDKVSESSDDMRDSVKRANKGLDDVTDRFDRVGDSAGNVDEKAMGFRDTITGLQDTFKGLTDDSLSLSDRLFTLGAGVGDLASGVENLGAPMIKAASQHAKGVATMVANNAKALGSTLVSVGRQVAAWAVLGVQSLANAAKVAAAWLISIGPILIVIAVVIALVILIIKNWDTIKAVIEAGWNWVREKTSAFAGWMTGHISGMVSGVVGFFTNLKDRTVGLAGEMKDKVVSAASGLVTRTVSKLFELLGQAQTAFSSIRDTAQNAISAAKDWVSDRVDDVVGFFRDLPGRITSALSGLAEAFKAPFRAAFDGIKNLWNSTLGGKGINIPGFLGFDGINFTIPRLAAGGIVRASPGGSIINAGEGGQDEVVAPLSDLPGLMRRAGIGGGTQTLVIDVRGGTSEVERAYIEMIRRGVATRGGLNVAFAD